MNPTTHNPARPPAVIPAGAGFYRLSVADYHRMIAADILTEDDPVELLGGYLVTKMPQGTPHGNTLDRLADDLRSVTPAGWRTRVQLPITLAESEPEPDVAVVRGDRQTFAGRHPGPTDFGVVFEVAASSLSEDRRVKGCYYAEAGIPVYWIVNLEDGLVEVYTDPNPAATPPAYRSRVDYRPGQDVPVVLDGQPVGAIPVAELIP
ncbi:MAG: Uma2 family endonuclease [Gemmataceae bacterium]|nr:Uma2 family endonuclease [Gemmataceae bacterium]